VRHKPGKLKYVLAAHGREHHEHARLDLLQQIFDPISRKRLDIVRPGWRCLEIGVGRGSIAEFLSERVGPAGEVVGTDINLGPSSDITLQNGRFVLHDFLVDPLEPLGGPGSFDLIHTRFLLLHMVGHQDEAIRRMVDLLKPGGWLVIEEIETLTSCAVDPMHPLSEAFEQGLAHMVDIMLASGTVDPKPGRTLPLRFADAGLSHIRHEALLPVERGGSKLARWYMESVDGARGGYEDDLYHHGGDLTQKALSEPDFWFQGCAEHCAWGRKPG
jgi:SAM-dependent methyltransferase